MKIVSTTLIEIWKISLNKKTDLNKKPIYNFFLNHDFYQLCPEVVYKILNIRGLFKVKQFRLFSTF